MITQSDVLTVVVNVLHTDWRKHVSIPCMIPLIPRHSASHENDYCVSDHVSMYDYHVRPVISCEQ
jgi:hypothetical protein